MFTKRAILLLVVACVGFLIPTSAASQEEQPQYWNVRGCDHGHRGFVAKKRITTLSQRPGVDFSRAWHYAVCTKTRAQHVRLVGHLRARRIIHIAHCLHVTSARGIGKCMAHRDKGWDSTQFGCLDYLWTHESGWQHLLWNYGGSGAYGIAQALPASKYPPAGRPEAPNGRQKIVAQISWGMDYIQGRYGTPCGALASWRVKNWY